jgi:hypothetical protein
MMGNPPLVLLCGCQLHGNSKNTHLLEVKLIATRFDVFDLPFLHSFLKHVRKHLFPKAGWLGEIYGRSTVYVNFDLYRWSMEKYGYSLVWAHRKREAGYGSSS